MASNASIDFDSMTVEEQIAHVQDLWSRVASAPEGVPVPDWHLTIVRERLAAHRDGTDGSRDWSEIYAELRGRS
jgi:hypothetical protein